jgi:hypothetical protein
MYGTVQNGAELGRWVASQRAHIRISKGQEEGKIEVTQWLRQLLMRID